MTYLDGMLIAAAMTMAGCAIKTAETDVLYCVGACLHVDRRGHEVDIGNPETEETD